MRYSRRMNRQYVTTAIDYPNAAPHMGHVLEKVLADVTARWFRLRGDDVLFQIGTDEHGTKIQRTAEKEGVTPRELVDRNVQLFEGLYQELHISHDRFIRTSDEQKHYPTVQELWKKLAAHNMLEKRSYTGLYCSGCERFMTEKELEDGLCPHHKKAPEQVTEENWFFVMSRYTKELTQLLTANWDGEQYRIQPEFRSKETLALLEQGLEDVSFSRPKSSLSWGVPVPEDAEQTMYVWCDALTNYISGLGFFTDHEEREWWDDATVTHVIGKDIARFHALIWPLMLKQAGERTPDVLLTHGFLTSEGEKMSKSLGNVVVPGEVLEKCKGNPDPIRFYLSHEVPVGRDGDFSWERFSDLYNSGLKNTLGNFLNRVLLLIKKMDLDLQIPDMPTNDREYEAKNIEKMWLDYEDKMNSHDLRTALSSIAMHMIGILNVDITQTEPWKIEDTQKKISALSEYAEFIRHVALMLLPFIPETAYRISKQLNVPYAEQMLQKDFVITEDMKTWGGVKDWKQIGEPEILFEPFDE